MRVLLIVGGLGSILGSLIWSTARNERCTFESPCEAPDNWFESTGTPAVPVDFKVPSDDECNFYKWGWQSFLWLTQSNEPNGGPRFLGFKSPNDLFESSGGKMQLVPAPPKGQQNQLSLSVRPTANRAIANVSAVAVGQAGSRGVVVDRNHRSLYYALHINDRFSDFITKELKLSDPSKIALVDPNIAFPPGCLELKSAWRVLTEEEKQPAALAMLRKRFFITEGLVPTLTASADGTILADPNQPRQETVALLALHVVGTIVDHPEFIWASFEHVDNAPVLPRANLPFGSPVDNDRDYTCYRKGTLRKDSNKNPVRPTNLLKLTDPKKQTLEPIVDIYRQFDSGENGVGQDPDVQSLNASVRTKLPGNLKIWGNYSMIGAVWFENPAEFFQPNATVPPADGLLAGETKLSNSTMETFTQQGKPNCFSCHNTTQETVNGKTLPGLRIKVSHILRNAYFGE